MNQNGFTYIEIVISFAIFSIMLLVVLKMSNSINAIMRHNQETNQMQHIAELEIENYKSGILDVPTFIAHTGFSLTSQITDTDGVVIQRVLDHPLVLDKYHIIINETTLNESISEIKVEVQLLTGNTDSVILYERIAKN